MNKHIPKIVIFFLVIGIFIIVNNFGFSEYLSLEYFKTNQLKFENYYAANKAKTLILYFLIYIITTALSLPGATILSLIGGALFGVLTGTILVSFGSTIGATLAFLGSRYLLRDWVQDKFGAKLKAINKGIEKEGAFYLFSLRLFPIFPFFIINLLMGLTPIKIRTYFFVSQLGMLAATIVYINAGSQLSKINNIHEVLSPTLLLSFALLGLFPFAAKKMLEMIKNNLAK